jgi:hypothetical protein
MCFRAVAASVQCVSKSSNDSVGSHLMNPLEHNQLSLDDSAHPELQRYGRLLSRLRSAVRVSRWVRAVLHIDRIQGTWGQVRLTDGRVSVEESEESRFAQVARVVPRMFDRLACVSGREREKRFVRVSLVVPRVVCV